MGFFELAKSRWSVRSYKDTPTEEEKMQLTLGCPAENAKHLDLHFQYRNMADMVEEI